MLFVGGLPDFLEGDAFGLPYPIPMNSLGAVTDPSWFGNTWKEERECTHPKWSCLKIALALWKWQMFEAHSLLFGDVMKSSEVTCWISLTIYQWDGGFYPLATSPVFLNFSFSRVSFIPSDSLGLNPILNESRLTSMFDPHTRATLLHIFTLSLLERQLLSNCKLLFSLCPAVSGWEPHPHILSFFRHSLHIHSV